MPLKLTVGKGEKLIVNGAVIRNDGEGTSLLFENQAHILRQKDILTQDSATTPASRVYLALQCAYLFPENADAHIRDCRDLLEAYLEAAPSARPIGAEVLDLVEGQQLYNALKQCCRLLEHESEVLPRVQ